MELAQHLKDIINSAGKEAFIIFLNQVTPELLIPYRELDAYVITAWPRIAIDDANLYKKPLLTPEELLIVMDKKKWDDYQMDEIKY